MTSPPPPAPGAFPRVLDPRAVPVAGTDAHLPALTAQHLHPQALRERFSGVIDWQPPLPGDGRVLPGREAAHAAVLVPLLARGDTLQVLLTQRTDHLRDHAGQISFPGGRSEPQDAGPAGTALREAAEEIGLDPARVEVIGQLPPYTTVTHFVVTPVVALLSEPIELRLDTFEVAEIFEVPLAHLMDPSRHQRHRFVFDGGERQFLSMPWTGPGPDGQPRERFIWGATAAMLRNLYHFLAR